MRSLHLLWRISHGSTRRPSRSASDPERLVRRRVEPRAARGRRAADPLLRAGHGAVPHAFRAGARARCVLSPSRRASRLRRARDGRDGALPVPRLAVRRHERRLRAHPLLREDSAARAAALVGSAGEERHGVRVAPRRGQAARLGLPRAARDRTRRLVRAADVRARDGGVRPGHPREQQRPGALPVRARDDGDAARRRSATARTAPTIGSRARASR